MTDDGGPAPAAPPTYSRSPGKVSHAHAWSVQDAIDGTFFIVGALLVMWLGWILLVRELAFSWEAAAYLIVFWLLAAYIGLPRLQEVLAKIFVPDYFIGRTLTGTGILGDPINLAADGSDADVHASMRRAGWTLADEVTLRSSWGIIMSAVLRRSYPSAPVSPLYLFGQRHAFAYEQEVDASASQRHHVRFWPVPAGWVLPGGDRVGWLAAGTYDRAVGLSAFTLQVTHKIDADIDVERDYVVATVTYADPRVSTRVIENFSTAFHSRNGGGDIVHTDGSLPVLELTGLGTTEADEQPVRPPVGGTPARSHRLPPPALMLCGLLSLAKAAVTIVSLLLVLLGAREGARSPDASTGQLITMGLGAVLVATLWLLTLARRRWARTGLMGVCAVEAVTALASLSAADRVTLPVLATTGLCVLILIAVSSRDAGRWVGGHGATAPRPTPSQPRRDRRGRCVPPA